MHGPGIWRRYPQTMFSPTFSFNLHGKRCEAQRGKTGIEVASPHRQVPRLDCIGQMDGGKLGQIDLPTGRGPPPHRKLAIATTQHKAVEVLNVISLGVRPRRPHRQLKPLRELTWLPALLDSRDLAFWMQQIDVDLNLIRHGAGR